MILLNYLLIILDYSLVGDLNLRVPTPSLIMSIKCYFFTVCINILTVIAQNSDCFLNILQKLHQTHLYL